MSTHSDSINPMSSFLKFSVISIAAIIILILLNNLLFKDEIKAESAKIEEKETVVDPKQIAENIKPIGQVTLATAAHTDATQAPRSGAEIYKTTCSICHLTGVANAPKIDDKAAWEPRVTAGLASLMTNAINGKGAMPPRGGKADLSDDELKATILHMTDLIGFELSEPTADKTADKTAVTLTTPSEVSTTSAPASVVTPEASSVPTPAVTAPVVPSAPTPVVTPEAPSAPAPVVTPEAPSAPASAVPSSSNPEVPVPTPEAAITPEAAALGYVLIPPTQAIPSVQPIEPQFPQQPISIM